jgi:diguanylate cyclase (GGDEF)-like protein
MKLNARTLVTGAILALFLPYAAYTLFGFGKPELDTFFDEGVHDVLMLAAAALAGARAIKVSRQRLAWSFIAAGMFSYAVAEVSYYLFLAKLEAPPYPSFADGLWLAFYPASYVGFVLLLRARVREFQASLWLDGLIASLAAAALGAAVIFGLVATDTGGSVGAVAMNLAYPLGDIVLLSIVMAVYALAGRRPGRDWIFLGAGLVVLAISDPVWLYQVAEGTYVPGGAIDLMYPLGMLLMGVAAWQPSRTEEIQLTGSRRLLLPVGAGLVGIVIETYDHFERVADIALVIATVLLVAITARFALSFRENLRTLANSNQDARTDALTMLGNRRSLIRDLEYRLFQREEFVLAMYDLNGFKVYNDIFGHLAGDALLARLGERLSAAAAEHGEAYRLGGDEFCVLIDPADVAPEVLVELMATALSEHGDAFSVTASYGWVAVPAEAHTCADALRLADRRMYAQKQGGRQSAGRQSTNVLLTALAARNPELGDHLAGVSELAEQVARRAGLGDAEVEEVRLGAELHDVGKMGLPDEILNRPGPLTAEEWVFVRRHTVIGERILFAAPALAGVATLVRSSHERWDGDGYPDGIAGDEIPLGSRIIAICDGFDAMMSDRPYRPAMSLDEAVAEVERCAGSQFDPTLVHAFSETIAARGQQPGGSHTARALAVLG